MSEKKGIGLGPCDMPPHPIRSIRCGCGAPKCAVCGYPKHAAVHLHCKGAKPGDPPFDHEYVPQQLKATS